MEKPVGQIMVVDDDCSMQELLNEYFRGQGYIVLPFTSAVEALKALKNESGDSTVDSKNVDVIVTDLKMAQMDGMEFLKNTRKSFEDIPVILTTAFGTIDSAVEAIRNGAYDYVVKPFKLVQMGQIVERAIEKRNLARDNEVLRQELKKESVGVHGVFGKSNAMKCVFDLVSRVSQSVSNILISGESGTGKEVIARLIHSKSPRANKEFIAINCTAIPETLLESELFGHARGSFTGAFQKKKGLFEEANGGTIFLDEIGDMSPSLQSKLLRVIQEKKIRAVGDNVLHDVDVRIIAATHKDLREAIRLGTFREDLFYRLSVIPIQIPPLRDRKDDIPILVDHFLKKYAATNGIQPKLLSQKALTKLMSFRWEGNVRELENLIERAVVLTPGSTIDEGDIHNPDIAENAETFYINSSKDFPSLSKLEERYIRFILDKTKGRKDKASHILGINRRTLYRKERDYHFVEDETSESQEYNNEPFREELALPHEKISSLH